MDPATLGAIGEIVPENLNVNLNLSPNTNVGDTTCCTNSCMSFKNISGTVTISFNQFKALEKELKKHKKENVYADGNTPDNEITSSKNFVDSPPDDQQYAAEEGIYRVYTQFSEPEAFGPYLTNLAQSISDVSLINKFENAEALSFPELETLMTKCLQLSRYKDLTETYIRTYDYITGNKEAPIKGNKGYRTYKKYARIIETSFLKWENYSETKQNQISNTVEILNQVSDDLQSMDSSQMIPKREAQSFIRLISSIYKSIYEIPDDDDL